MWEPIKRSYNVNLMIKKTKAKGQKTVNKPQHEENYCRFLHWGKPERGVKEMKTTVNQLRLSSQINMAKVNDSAHVMYYLSLKV